MTKKKSFVITDNHGKQFSKESGDNNKIHLFDDYAYNSIFGKKICFGSQILIKILDIINFSYKKNYYIKVQFNKPVFYNSPIDILINNKKDNSQIIKIFQLKKYIGFIEILRKKSFLSENFKNELRVKKMKNKPLNKKIQFKNISVKDDDKTKFKNLIKCVSKYVGVYNPGENSLLLEIEIYLNNENDLKKFKINSSEIDERFKLIDNYLEYQNFRIFFKSLVRPRFSMNKKYIYSTKFIKKIKSLKDNVLLIGASQGIGLQMLQALKMNKSIKIYASYNKNKIFYNDTNISKIKCNIKNDLKKIFNIIDKNNSLKIFYFISDKIYFEKKLKNDIKKSYKNIFVDIPIKIIKKYSKNDKISFFYPSTTFIDIDKNTTYSKIKLIAENKLRLLKKNAKIKIMVHRFPAIYSRQSINLFDREPISLNKYLEKNSNLLKHIVNKN